MPPPTGHQPSEDQSETLPKGYATPMESATPPTDMPPPSLWCMAMATKHYSFQEGSVLHSTRGFLPKRAVFRKVLLSVVLQIMASDTSDQTPSCGICFEEYEEEGEKKPKLLPCSHTFCLQCLRQLSAHGTEITCPECRDVTRLPQGGVANFPTNRYVLEIIRITRRNDSENNNRADDDVPIPAPAMTFFTVKPAEPVILVPENLLRDITEGTSSCRGNRTGDPGNLPAGVHSVHPSAPSYQDESQSNEPLRPDTNQPMQTQLGQHVAVRIPDTGPTDHSHSGHSNRHGTTGSPGSNSTPDNHRIPGHQNQLDNPRIPSSSNQGNLYPLLPGEQSPPSNQEITPTSDQQNAGNQETILPGNQSPTHIRDTENVDTTNQSSNNNHGDGSHVDHPRVSRDPWLSIYRPDGSTGRGPVQNSRHSGQENRRNTDNWVRLVDITAQMRNQRRNRIRIQPRDQPTTQPVTQPRSPTRAWRSQPTTQPVTQPRSPTGDRRSQPTTQPRSPTRAWRSQPTTQSAAEPSHQRTSDNNRSNFADYESSCMRVHPFAMN